MTDLPPYIGAAPEPGRGKCQATIFTTEHGINVECQLEEQHHHLAAVQHDYIPPDTDTASVTYALEWIERQMADATAPEPLCCKPVELDADSRLVFCNKPASEHDSCCHPFGPWPEWGDTDEWDEADERIFGLIFWVALVLAGAVVASIATTTLIIRKALRR